MKLLTQFYTTNRALQILVSFGIKAVKVMEVKVMRCCVWVKYRTKSGICSLFVSVKAFLKLAIAGRKERAVDYIVTQRSNPRQWNVSNYSDLTQPGYTVVTADDLVTCNCKDFAEMAEYLPQHPYVWNLVKARRACKHIYSVLSELSCTSLVDYFNKVRTNQLPQLTKNYSISVAQIKENVARL